MMDDGMVDHEASPFLYGTYCGVRSTEQNTVMRHTSHDVRYSEVCHLHAIVPQTWTTEANNLRSFARKRQIQSGKFDRIRYSRM